MAKNKLILCCLFLFLGVFVFSIGNNNLSILSAKDSSLYKELELFTEVVNIVQKSYVDDVSSVDLIYGALSGMMDVLDPYSQFLNPTMYKELKVETEGRFAGIGAEVTIKDEYLVVITALEGTPAWEAGLKPNDVILKIDGVSTKKLSLPQAVDKLRGKAGSKVTITVSREGVNEEISLEIKRDIIKINSINRTELMENKIGYIQLIQFQDGTVKDFKEQLMKFEVLGISALILDLRNNPGGLLNEAVGVADCFFSQGELIVFTKGKIGNQNLEFKSELKSSCFNKPLIVLINRGSASGAEIVAGAIADHKRGLIVGTRSFGKGSVQSLIPFKDGSAIRLTTAKYYTPAKKSIVSVGVVPDVEVVNQDKEDSQLKRAIDILKGINLYMDKQKK